MKEESLSRQFFARLTFVPLYLLQFTVTAALVAMVGCSPTGLVTVKRNTDLSVAESGYHYPDYHSAGHKHAAYGHHAGAHGLHHGGHYGSKDHYADGGYGKLTLST